MKRDLPSVHLLRELFAYDPETGVVTRRISRSNQQAGSTVGWVRMKDGYLSASVHKRCFLLHRIVWALFHGEWPNGEVDHVNGVSADNRIANLRDTTHAGNMYNQVRRRPPRSGHRGVDRISSGRYRVRVKRHDGRRTQVGIFETIEEASLAYKAANLAAQEREKWC